MGARHLLSVLRVSVLLAEQTVTWVGCELSKLLFAEET